MSVVKNGCKKYPKVAMEREIETHYGVKCKVGGVSVGQQ